MADFRPPSDAEIQLLTGPSRAYFRPRFRGLEHLSPGRPALLVGNHTLLGLLDAPLLVAEIYRARGIWLRALGDRIHFKLPGWSHMLRRYGVVVGSRESCAALMRQGHHVLVFPGGGREVAKRKGEAYELIWKERTGFARMAIDHGYPIVPFGAVGAEDCFDILLDADDVLDSKLGGLLRRTPLIDAMRGGDAMLPLVRGWLGTPVPKRKRFYFALGEAIQTDDLSQKDASVIALRDRTRGAIERLLEELKAQRQREGE